MTATLELTGLGRRYPGSETLALDDVSLVVPAGACTAVVGPSGSGKTTLLRLIAGLDQPTHGVVSLDGRDLNRTVTEARGMSMVFQKPLLFPHLSVVDNVAFSARMSGQSHPAARQHARRYLDLVELADYAGRGSGQLSGGQQQRVALARALAAEPQVLLLDEPFSTLDAALRDSMHDLLRRIRAELDPTIVVVTHDQREAASVADSIAVLNHGQLLQHDTVDQIYARPASVEVHRLLGGQNVIVGEIHNGLHHSALGTLELPPQLATPNRTAALVFRQESVRLTDHDGAKIRGLVTATDRLGPRRRITCQVAKVTVIAEVSAGLAPMIGSTVGIELAVSDRHVVPLSGE